MPLFTLKDIKNIEKYHVWTDLEKYWKKRKIVPLSLEDIDLLAKKVKGI